MFDVKKFGAIISKRRKECDMSQAHLADLLGFTRQAISNYECGNAFPDIETIIKISEIFQVSVDELITGSGATKTETKLLLNKKEFTNDVALDEVINVAPYVKPTTMDKIAEVLAEQGIDISNILELSEFISDDGVYSLLKKADFKKVDTLILKKLIPFLTEDAKYVMLDKIMEHELDAKLLIQLVGSGYNFYELIENAVVCGVLDYDILSDIREARNI
ncbi:MAG: helix-turn-helix domain-containing protein [Bacilli bacterium]|nr:helix-turn-helix domain-containing protein [Bacilli bacterium]MDY0208581.1 helix-turn-helix domain-containing protein [Bacilli bacterium]